MPSPLDDQDTYALLQRGDSIGVFQLEGGPMRSLMRSLAPTSFDDIAALVALYRPGPMGVNMHNDYADMKNGRKPVTYFHPDAEDLLADTYGLMVYQESMMRVAQRFAGYSLAEADNLRKACGKKKRDLMARERSKFIEGCENTGTGSAMGVELFNIIENFADYAFGKSHSYGYGLVAYQTAYLKAHYPVEYLAALLTSVKTNLDKAAIYLNECRVNSGITGAGARRKPVSSLRLRAGSRLDDGSVKPSRSASRRCATWVQRSSTTLVAERSEADGPYARTSTTSATGCNTSGC